MSFKDNSYILDTVWESIEKVVSNLSELDPAQKSFLLCYAVSRTSVHTYACAFRLLYDRDIDAWIRRITEYGTFNRMAALSVMYMEMCMEIGIFFNEEYVRSVKGFKKLQMFEVDTWEGPVVGGADEYYMSLTLSEVCQGGF